MAELPRLQSSEKKDVQLATKPEAQNADSLDDRKRLEQLPEPSLAEANFDMLDN